MFTGEATTNVPELALGGGLSRPNRLAHPLLALAPRLAGVDVADWHALDALVETGYSYAKKALDTWDYHNLT